MVGILCANARVGMVLLALVITAPAQQRVPVRGDRPVALMSMTDDQGKECGTLYVLPGETIAFDGTQHPTAGAGYYEGNPDCDVPVGTYSEATAGFSAVTFEGNQNSYLTLRVHKIEWDHNGNLRSIDGLRPSLELMTIEGIEPNQKTSKQIGITSDVREPKIADGRLYITLQNRGSREYWVKTRFGHIVAVGTSGLGLGGLVYLMGGAGLLLAVGAIVFVWLRQRG